MKILKDPEKNEFYSIDGNSSDGYKLISFSQKGVSSTKKIDGTSMNKLSSNLLTLTGKEKTSAQELFDKIGDLKMIREEEDFSVFVNQSTMDFYIHYNGEYIPIDEADKIKSFSSSVKKLSTFIKSKSKPNYNFGDRILKYGPTGTGKTYDFLNFAKDNSIDNTLIIPITEGMEDIDFFVNIIPDGKGFIHREKEVSKLLKKAEAGEKVLIVFDELNRGSNALMNLVIKALDAVNGEYYSLYDSITDTTYNIPIDNIIWGATVNLGGKYSGTNTLDEALFDRFNIVQYVGYDKDVEKSIISSVIKTKTEQQKIIKFIDEIREYHQTGNIRSPISTRGVKVWIEGVLNGMSISDAFCSRILFRLVSVDDYGNPNPDEIGILQKKFQEIFT